MIILILLGLLAVVSSVFADVTFNVIGFPGAKDNSFAVEIDKKLYPLRTSKTAFPLWSAVVADASASSSYRYVELNNKGAVAKSENFLRSLGKEGASATLNEFFDRETTISRLPTVRQVYKDVRPKPSKAVDDSQIATINLTGDEAALDDMLAHPLVDRKLVAGFKFINANNVYTVDNVKLKVSGHASRKYNKVSMSIEFDITKGQTFFDRPAIKLRAERTDSTMIREKLYTDILASVGVPSTQGSYVRVYFNGKPLGFYLMIEDIEAPYLMNTVHHGEIKDVSALGSLFKINSGKSGTGRWADLRYQGARTADYDLGLYKNQFLGANPANEPMKQLIAFMKDLQEWNPASPGGIEYWNQRLDLQGFLRSMAVEYLTGAWDSFWWRSNNYFMYYNPQRKVWQFLPTDFDHTFTNGNRPGVETTYKDYGLSAPDEDKAAAPLVNKIIYKNKDTNREFENILLTITKGVFNSGVLDARIDGYVAQIEQDVAWDFSVDRSRRPGQDPGWTIAKFHKTIDDRNKSLKAWINGRDDSVLREIGRSNA
ncbi:hypothetical protein BGZ96_012450 [Linnemannia gamsii]|uniref:Uncharacterized protein n=1 Tax=Linnemannia gamsii TaxID=64522 RepID=A0ABQ7KAM0_9FUNG|nr:hypothetical protein BGZ96_012450 [Linnemannia gamsii]